MRILMIVLGIAFLLSFKAAADTVEPYEYLPYSDSPQSRAPWAMGKDSGPDNRHARALRADILGGRLAERTDTALANMIRLVTHELDSHGFRAEAFTIRRQFEVNWRGYLSRHTLHGSFRNIGDHKPLSDWLVSVYNAIEAKLIEALGPEAAMKVMKALRITDIKTFNYCIPVVFNPCNTAEWDADEYVKHFHGDELLNGLIPVVGYWVAWGTCQVVTLGTGWFLVCSPVGFGCEYAIHEWISYDLGHAVYQMVCNTKG